MPDRYLTFERDDWAALRAATPLTLSQADLDSLQGINERIDLDEVTAIYLPLSRLLNLYVSAVQDLQRVSSTFLGSMAPKVPYIVGVAGSVAVGKSTFARILLTCLPFDAESYGCSIQRAATVGFWSRLDHDYAISACRLNSPGVTSTLPPLIRSATSRSHGFTPTRSPTRGVIRRSRS